ncbi:MAG: hypothetical protein GF355_11890 [Candidatus Eisenbacteria bacterium]|nr:hypothetical protein [Candidatus Eisenbacteria bacterium]
MAFVLSDQELAADLHTLLQDRYDVHFYPDLIRMLDDVTRHPFEKIFLEGDIPELMAIPYVWVRFVDAIKAKDQTAVYFLGEPETEVLAALERAGIEVHLMKSRPRMRQLRGLLNPDPGEMG